MKGTFTVATRIWMGLRGDPRTLGLVLFAPFFIVYLFGEVLDEVPPQRFDADFVKPVLLGFFAYFLTYLLTAIGFLRERQSGTLERVLASPAQRVGLVLGYIVGFGALALVVALSLLAAGTLFLDVEFQHGVTLFFLLELAGALSALGLGILLSFAAHNEFQILQFIPIVIAPQVILGGVFIPVERLPAYLEIPARAMPLTYFLEGMEWVILGTGEAGHVGRAFVVLGAWTLGAVALAALLLRRRG